MNTEHVPRTRQHTVYQTTDGERVPGVTTICGIIDKPALKAWANRLGLSGIELDKYTDGLADIGTLAHQMAVDHLRGTETDLSDWSPNQVSAAENCFIKVLSWLENHEVEVLLSETPLVSELYGYGGTPDIIGIVDGVREVLDIKTAKAIWPEMVYQAAAYRHLANEHDYGPIERVRILQVGRSDDEGEWSEKVVAGEKLEQNWAVFKAALDLYEAIKVARRKT